MNIKEQYPIFYEAYQHYLKTNDRHFNIHLKNETYTSHFLYEISTLFQKGFICNVSDKLLIDNFAESSITFNISPPESLSFDITISGIRFADSNRES